MRDRNLLEIRKFININRGVIYGMMLGDGTVSNRGTSANFRINHAPGQREYLEFKRALFGEVASETKLAVNGKTKQEFYYFYTLASSEWQRVWSVFHQDSRKITVGAKSYVKKVVTPVILRDLNDFGVALWCLDDGYLTHGSFIISTCSFDRTEHELMAQWFAERYGLRAAIYEMNNVVNGQRRPYLKLAFGVEHTKHLIDLIRPYVPPCMAYKVDGSLQVQGRLHSADDDALRTSEQSEEAGGNDQPVQAQA